MDTITIMHRHTGAVLYSHQAAPNRVASGLAMRDALEAASLAGANLDGASLAGANLAGASLAGASLAGANLARASLAGAYLAGANLARASLAGASLDGAYLSKASLDGASLIGASLAGASLIGAKIVCKVAQIRRDDGYEFIAFAVDDGRTIIRAGCRTMTPTNYRAHVSAKYPDTPKATETLAILDFIEARAAALVGPAKGE